ncbi:transposase family protein [Streptomyces sp. NPDC016469]|uniref:transposase family protein n=1 Tax=Streptomyces sp. NPDC016469 TaxID=3157191 RepID=UPI0033FFE4EA
MLPIDRNTADRPYYSEKKHHRMNVQVLADPAGRLIWASDALPGDMRDLTADRTHHIPAVLSANDTKFWADQSGSKRTTCCWRPVPRQDPARLAPTPQPRSAASGDRAMATLKCWRLLRKLPLQHHPDLCRPPCRRRPRSRHLIKMERAHCVSGVA